MSQRGEYVKHHGGKDVEIDVEVVKVGRLATLVKTDVDGEDQEVWIPNSQIVSSCRDANGNVDTIGKMTITQWIAEQKGLA